MLIEIKNFLYDYIAPFFVNPNKIVNTFGGKMHLDDTDSLLLSLRANHFEKDYLNFIKGIIKEGDTVIDVGAHIGYYTLVFSKLVGPKGKVFAFEPSPKIFEILRKNVELNECKNVKIYDMAISNKKEEVDFYFSLRKTANGRAWAQREKEKDKNWKSVKVKTINLDSFCEENNIRPDFLKIDTEGFEPNVFYGMPKLLKQGVVLVSEFSQRYLRESPLDPDQYFKLLSKLDYNFTDLHSMQHVDNFWKLREEYNRLKKTTYFYGVPNKNITPGD